METNLNTIAGHLYFKKGPDILTYFKNPGQHMLKNFRKSMCGLTNKLNKNLFICWYTVQESSIFFHEWAKTSMVFCYFQMLNNYMYESICDAIKSVLIISRSTCLNLTWLWKTVSNVLPHKVEVVFKTKYHCMSMVWHFLRLVVLLMDSFIVLFA